MRGAHIGHLLLASLLASLAACGGSGREDVGQRLGYAYVSTFRFANSRSMVYEYAIAPDGALIASNNSVSAGIPLTSMTSDPSGRYVYVASAVDATISQFVVGSGGRLMPLSPPVVGIASGFYMIGSCVVSIDPSGRFLYVVTTVADEPAHFRSIAQYSIGSSGALTPLNPSGVYLGENGSDSLAFSPDGHYAYIVGEGGTRILQFSIGDDGTLTSLGATATATPSATSVAFAPNGESAYVLSRCVDSACNGQIARYAVAANGALIPTAEVTLTGSYAYPISMVVDDSVSSAYVRVSGLGVATIADTISQYKVGSTGALTPYPPGSLTVSAGSGSLSIIGSNGYVLASNPQVTDTTPGGHIDHYKIDADGSLTLSDRVQIAGDWPTGMALAVMQ